MSKSRRARRATPLFAGILSAGLLVGSAGLLACLGNTQAGEFGPPPLETHEFKLASVAPFEQPRDAPAHRLSEPFGLETDVLMTGGLQNQWSAVTAKLPQEREILTRCRTDADTCPPAAKKFLAIVDQARTRDGLARIGEINRAINRTIRGVDDMTQYGVADLWATPLMTFASGAGDCEDYAIAKYVALREIGIAADDLRLLIVVNRTTDLQHAVAAVRYGGRWLILDNLTTIMVPDVDLAAYYPLYVVDNEGVKYRKPWSFKAHHPTANESPATVGPWFSSGWQNAPLLM